LEAGNGQYQSPFFEASSMPQGKINISIGIVVDIMEKELGAKL